MIALEKWKILTPLQKLPKNVGDLGKIIVAKAFKKCKKSPNLVTLDENVVEWECEQSSSITVQLASSLTGLDLPQTST